MVIERIILPTPIKAGGGASDSSAMTSDTSTSSWEDGVDGHGHDPATARVRDQGHPGGLFRACMDTIRVSHSLGQTLRSAALVAGLMTDKFCYAELLGQFYIVTVALETRMEELLFGTGHYEDCTSKLLVAKMKVSLGYSFSKDYEADLIFLLGPEWRSTIESWTTPPAKRYIERLQTATDEECIAAAFILHGPLVIGGGATLRPKVLRAFGEGATNVFTSVCGVDAKGRTRASRRKEFIEFYDTLLTTSGLSTKDDVRSWSSPDPPVGYKTIVKSCSEFMDLNNEMMMAVRKSPWWKKYATACAVATVSFSAAIFWRLLIGPSSSSSTDNSNKA